MSYARFGVDGSDVYVYLDVADRLCCCACPLGAPPAGSGLPPSRGFGSTDDLLAHLREHVAAGHVVPEDTFADLERDRAENDALLSERGAPP